MPSGLHTGLFYIEGRARCTLEPCSRSDKSMLYHNAIANLRVIPHNSTCSSYQYLCISYSFAVMYVWYSSVVLRNTIAIRSHTIQAAESSHHARSSASTASVIPYAW